VASRPLIGIQLPEVEREVPWPEYLAIARTAEEVGFDSIWVGDHLLYRDPDRGPWEAWTLLGALAACTGRVALGPLVACTAFHPPGLIAKMAATLAEISGGRFVLGLGAGWNEDEVAAHGLPFYRRVTRFEAAFTTIRRMISGEEPTLLPRREPPMVIGSNGPRMLSIAAPRAQVWNTWYRDFGNTPEGFMELSARIPEQLERSACLLVQFDGMPVERVPEVPAVPEARFPDALRELGEAGADEVIVVASPITERSIRALGEALN